MMEWIVSRMQELFLVCLVMTLAVSGWMSATRHGMYFVRWTRRYFTILDIEFPSSPRYYATIMNSIKRLRADGFGTGKPDPVPYRSLRTNIWLDFVFIWFAYGCVALMCLHVARNLAWAPWWFEKLAVLQGVALLLDVIENSFILFTMKRQDYFHSGREGQASRKKSAAAFNLYRSVVFLKWTIVLAGLFLSIGVVLYTFLFTGYYSKGQVLFGLAVMGIILASSLLTPVLVRRTALYKKRFPSSVTTPEASRE